MLRLDLKDRNETVLFIDPTKEVKVRKECTEKKSYYELSIETESGVCYAIYYTEGACIEAYKYVLNKINEYLFPLIESVELGSICPNDAAMPEYLRKPKEV